MRNLAILYPVFGLAAWTAVVLLLLPLARARAGFRKQIVLDDFKYGEAPTVPPHVSIPNRNLMNLLELPVLFYVVCLMLYVTGSASSLAVALAWTYVALRILHSLIHLTYNRVLDRSLAFGASNAVLATIWAIAGLHLAH